MSISDADRAPELDYVATVYHGIDLDGLPFAPDGGPGLVVFGRIHPDKGTHTAIEIARRGRPAADHLRHRPGRAVLRRAGGARTSTASGSSTSVRSDRRRRGEILGASAALLHPIDFDEPFGLSVVESMACGTPVVAYRRGSMPEVVDEGVTGLLVDTVDAGRRGRRPGSRTIDRAAAGPGPAQRFGADRMVDDYLRVYRDIIADGRR